MTNSHIFHVLPTEHGLSLKRLRESTASLKQKSTQIAVQQGLWKLGADKQGFQREF